jgi:tetratricopeptide (TPR) repeat protein
MTAFVTPLISCHRSIDAPKFSITIMRESESQEPRQLGSIELATAQILASQLPGRKKGVYDVLVAASPFDYHQNMIDISMMRMCTNVKDAEVPLELSVSVFIDVATLGRRCQSVASQCPPDYSTVDLYGYEHITLLLRQMLAGKSAVDPGMLPTLHDEILLLPNTNVNKAPLLKKLDEVHMKLRNVPQSVDDLNRAVCVYGDAVKNTEDDDPMKAAHLNDLGTSLLDRFEQLGDITDITKSVLMCENAVRLTPDSHWSKATRLANLGNSFLACFSQVGDLTDIDKALAAYEDALKLTPDGHADQPAYMNNLSGLLNVRFQRQGSLADINKSIVILGNMVHLTSDGHPDKPACFINLGIALRYRFAQFGDLIDIKKAISMQEDGIRITLDSDPNKPGYLCSLGRSLLDRFERLGDPADLNEAVLVNQDAVRLTPDSHSDMPLHFQHLASSLLCRFQRLGDLADLTQSIQLFEDAAHRTSDAHPSKPGYLSNLGHSLRCRFMKHSDLADINRSIMLLENAVHLTPKGHPQKPSRLNRLNQSLLRRYRHLHSPDDLAAVYHNFSLAAHSSTGPPTIQFAACSAWALSARAFKHSSLLEAYKAALVLLPHLAWLGLSISSRHHQVQQAGNVVRDAAAAAIEAGQLHTAVEWLEQGRSVIWGQLVQLRSPLDDLKQVRPDLADQLIQICRDLDSTGTSEGFTGVGVGSDQRSAELVAQWCHSLAMEREELLKSIRMLEGFDRFLLPKAISELTPAAHAGPVVILNASRFRCDALVISQQSDLVLVPLTGFTYNNAQELHKSLKGLLH